MAPLGWSGLHSVGFRKAAFWSRPVEFSGRATTSAARLGAVHTAWESETCPYCAEQSDR